MQSRSESLDEGLDGLRFGGFGDPVHDHARKRRILDPPDRGRGILDPGERACREAVIQGEQEEAALRVVEPPEST